MRSTIPRIVKNGRVIFGQALDLIQKDKREVLEREVNQVLANATI